MLFHFIGIALVNILPTPVFKFRVGGKVSSYQQYHYMKEILRISVYTENFLGDKWEWVYFAKFRALLAISKRTF